MKTILDSAIADADELSAIKQHHRADGLSIGSERDLRRPVARRKRSQSSTDHLNRPSLNRHARKCAVCHHKDRAAIESDFLHWHSPAEIIHDYKIRKPRTLYRHAHATGLFNQRMQNIRYAAAHMVDHAETVRPSAIAVLKAMRACSLIDEHGNWTDPPTRIIRYEGDLSMLPENQKPNATSNTGLPNRHQSRLKNAATPTKQSPDDFSNGH